MFEYIVPKFKAALAIHGSTHGKFEKNNAILGQPYAKFGVPDAKFEAHDAIRALDHVTPALYNAMHGMVRPKKTLSQY